MTDLNSLVNSVGSWQGKYSLWVSPDDVPEISNSDLSILSLLQNKFIRIDYTWEIDNQSQEGTLTIGFETKKVLYTAIWLDTWHMGEKYMACQGLIDENGSIVLRGYYEVTEGPDWGWKTVIEIGKEDSLRITMFNMTPEGKEQLAVKSVYKKTA